MSRFKIAFAIIILLIYAGIENKLSAQISLDTIIPHAGLGYFFFPAQISETETKYIFCDTVTNTFDILNMDFTPFLLNISVPQPFNGGTMQVMYTSRSLFDCDTTNIEYAFGATSVPYQPYYIVRTDGTILMQVDSAFGPYCVGGCQGMSDYTRPIRNTSDGAKLFLYKQLQPGQIQIYSLCGSLPTAAIDYMNINESYVKVYPNPSKNILMFQIIFPDNLNQYEIVIFDENGRELRRDNLNVTIGKYEVDVSTFTNGAYFYSLCTKEKSYQSGKFVISK